MWTIALLIFHGVTATLLVGAASHQAITTWFSRTESRGKGFFSRISKVSPQVYTNSVVWLYLITLLLGVAIYPEFRVNIRSMFDLEIPAATGGFEIKEHISSLGVGLLPAYWYFWSGLPTRLQNQHKIERLVLTSLLTFIVWTDFLVGHILNNLQGIDA